MREGVEFYRRCWRHQPVLSATQAGVLVLLGLVSLVKLTADDPPNLSGASTLLILAGFGCFVLLIRRDEPDIDA